jgi:hypothetical protein
MNVGWITARLGTSSEIRPSTAVANRTCMPKASRTFPNECDSGSHRYCRSSMVTIPSVIGCLRCLRGVLGGVVGVVGAVGPLPDVWDPEIRDHALRVGP